MISVAFTIVAAAMTVFWVPGCSGSGMAETLGYVNGINYPGFLGFAMLLTKILGVCLAIAGGLRIGKEGPLCHIGSIIGVITIYLPCRWNLNFRNDYYKRLLVASGLGVGVAVAFGAPIGGSLFAYEVAKDSSFWNFTIAWRTFFATSLAVFTLGCMHALKSGHVIDIVSGGLVKFANIQFRSYEVQDIPTFILIGSIGGLIGALFVKVNTKLTLLRK